MKKTVTAISVILILLLMSPYSWAKRYKVIQVKNGGILKGKVVTAVKVKDPIIPIKISPREKPEDAKKIRQTCGTSQKANMYLISPDGGVKNVIVAITDIKAGKAAPKKDYVINNKDCRFDPLVGIAYVRGKYVIKNSDPILHNTSLGKIVRKGVRRTIYNIALPYKDQVVKKRNRVSGLIDVKCDAHAWMRAYVYSSKHPYVAITDDRGNFEIRDIPPGTYTVLFWHEGFQQVKKKVTIKPGKVTTIKVTFTKTREPDFMKRLK